MIKRYFVFTVLLMFAVSCFQHGDSNGSKNRESLGLLGIAAINSGGGAAGADGAVLTSDDNRFSVMIPPGAMDSEEEFTITRYSLSDNSLSYGYIPTAYSYEVTPSYRFKKEVTVSIKMDTSRINSLNLNKDASMGFISSSTSDSENSGRIFGGWDGTSSRISGDSVVFETRTFSIFGAGTPTAGNGSPNIIGSYYDFKPTCSFLPYQVRAKVKDPDGDSLSVYLIVGPEGGSTVAIEMKSTGKGNYVIEIPYEAMGINGIQMQVMAVDDQGNSTSRPANGMFVFPADAQQPKFVSDYNPDQDGDGYNDAWEVDNGFSPNDSSIPLASSFPDSDGDGIPDIADATPQGPGSAVIDKYTLFPEQVTAYPGESITFSAMASFQGNPVIVESSYTTTGNAWSGAPVGEIIGSVFKAVEPGLAGVQSKYNDFSANASVTVKDTFNPGDITDLNALALSSNKVRLSWTAPGNDGSSGKVAAYEIRRSGNIIKTDSECSAAMALNHGLTPKSAGTTEVVDLVSHLPSTTYYYCVRAYDFSGNRSVWNGNVSATTFSVSDMSAPADINDLTATVVNDRSVDLAWTAVGEDGNSGSATYYEIKKSFSPINNDDECSSAAEVVNNIQAQAAGTSIGFRVGNLSSNSVYYFCVRAYDSVGNRSYWNGNVSATTLRVNMAPVVRIEDIVGSIPQAESVTLNGNYSSDPDAVPCGADVSNYQIKWTVSVTPFGSAITDANLQNSDSLEMTFTPDIPGLYTLTLQFLDDAGTCYGGPAMGVSSITLDVVEKDITPPDHISNYSAQGISTDQIQVSWYNTGDDGMTGNAQFYKIGVSLLPVTNSTECSNLVDKRYAQVDSYIPGTSVTSVVGGLIANTTYYFCIVAEDESGNESPWDGSLSANTLEGTSGWSAWSEWSSCSVNCTIGQNYGYQTRTRTCDDPISGCAGSNSEVVQCNTRQCAFTYKTVTSNSAVITAYCPSQGYDVWSTSYYEGKYRRDSFDYWGSLLACGAINRDGSVYNAPGISSISSVVSSVGKNGKKFTFLGANPPAADTHCTKYTVTKDRYVYVSCRETP